MGELDEINFHGMDEKLLKVLRSAARLQELLPEATLVGGSAAAMYANHRMSIDHDHVMADLRDRFDAVLDALESDPEWVTNRVMPGKVILGQIGEIEAGVRQLIRVVPLEVLAVTLPTGESIRVPTQEETLRIKAYLTVKRNQTRDYLDIAALAHSGGRGQAARTLVEIDRFYTDPRQEGVPVTDQILRQLSAPRPKDAHTVGQLASYKGLRGQWARWEHVVAILQDVVGRMERGDYS